MNRINLNNVIDIRINKTYNYNYRYNTNKPKYKLRIFSEPFKGTGYRSNSQLYLDPTNKLKISNSLFSNISNNNNITIKPEHKVFFSKSSSYPRYKLREFTNNKKVNDYKKSDLIVIDKVQVSVGNINIKYDSNNGIYYRFNIGYGIDINDPSILNDINNYLISEHKIKYNYLQDIEVKELKYPNNINTSEDYLDIITNYSDKIISEDQLEKYISSFTNEMTEDEYATISQYLKSTDLSTINVGLRLLTNYDTDKSIIPISLLCLFNCDNISRAKDFNSVGFKVIKNKVSTSLGRHLARGYMTNPKVQISCLDALTTYCKTDKDREDIRTYGLPMIKQMVNTFIDQNIKDVQFINEINININ